MNYLPSSRKEHEVAARRYYFLRSDHDFCLLPSPELAQRRRRRQTLLSTDKTYSCDLLLFNAHTNFATRLQYI
jgi:hypothetical protein